MFYVNDSLKGSLRNFSSFCVVWFGVLSSFADLVFDELDKSGSTGGQGGFIPAVQQIANVATLPGIVGKSLGMPDLHSGYGFSIGGFFFFFCSLSCL